jgi:3-oxoacyl-[acyl-carrier protein] reductase
MAERRCFVLGGSGHVGQAVVQRLTAAGAQVAFTFDRHADRAREIAATTGAHTLHFNAADREPDFGALWPGEPIDAVVQCIGTAGDPELYRLHEQGYDKFLATSLDEWQSMHDITATSTFTALKALAPRLARGGNVLVVGSIDGVKIVPAPVHYAAAKSAASGMVRALAKALGPRGVCVNMVALGILDGGVGSLLSEALRAQYLKHCSLARLGKADEVAQLVSWMALHNSYVSGQAITLDGGL